MIVLNVELVCPGCGQALQVSWDDFVAIKEVDEEILMSFDCPECGEEFVDEPVEN